MDKDEALKLALEALGWTDEWRPQGLKEEAITAIKEALAQPEHIGFMDSKLNPIQRTWVGLTNDEVNNFAAGCHLGKSVQGAIYEAEAKLKEKNTCT
jgi:hypothetical protein